MSSSSLPAQADVGAGSKLGRAAGFGYLAIFVTGIAWYAPMQGFRAGGDAVLLGHIRDGRQLFEVSVLAGAASFVAYLVTAVLLYRRFSAEAGIAAGLLFTFVVASVPVSLVAVARETQLLTLLDAVGLSVQDQQAQAALIMRDFDTLSRVSSLFWGLWLLPLAWLAFRSGGIGLLVGVFLALGGIGYMSIFVMPLLGPAHPLGPVDFTFAGATVLSEFVVTLWLILAADRPRKLALRP